MKKNNTIEDDKKLMDNFADIKKKLTMLNDELVVELEKKKEASNKVDTLRRRKSAYYNQIEDLEKAYFKGLVETASGEISIDANPPFRGYRDY